MNTEQKLSVALAQAALVDQDINSIESQLDIAKARGEADPIWEARARCALRYRVTEKKAANRAIARLEAELKNEKQLALAVAKQAMHQAKAERLRLSIAKDARDIALFRSVAREVLGDEMYMHIWELVNQRAKEQA